jgi:hypothetical protein
VLRFLLWRLLGLLAIVAGLALIAWFIDGGPGRVLRGDANAGRLSAERRYRRLRCGVATGDLELVAAPSICPSCGCSLWWRSRLRTGGRIAPACPSSTSLRAARVEAYRADRAEIEAAWRCSGRCTSACCGAGGDGCCSVSRRCRWRCTTRVAHGTRRGWRSRAPRGTSRWSKPAAGHLPKLPAASPRAPARCAARGAAPEEARRVHQAREGDRPLRADRRAAGQPAADVDGGVRRAGVRADRDDADARTVRGASPSTSTSATRRVCRASAEST